MIGLVCFAIILVSWFGGVKYPKGIPAGLVAIAVGMLIAWGSNLFGLGLGGMSLQGRRRCLCELRLLGAAAGHRPRLLRLRVPRHHPGHRDSVRHLRSRRGHGQRRERGSGRRRLSDHARAHRRRRRQPDRLPDGQSVHQRGLHRPSRLEGDGRPHRLFGRDRHHGDRAVLVRHHLGDAGAGARGRDLADPALHRHADRRAGVPDTPASTRRRSCWR